jgi:hypothetical protein
MIKKELLTGFFCLVALLLLNVSAVDQLKKEEMMTLNSSLPNEIQGWSAKNKDIYFSRETIFDYMNGAGEVYLSYDFKKLLVREYIKEAAPGIVVEIYYMSSSEDAFGIFTHDTDGEMINLAQGAIYAMGLLRSWKDRFFVRIQAEKETELVKPVILQLGELINNAIPGEGKKPALLSCLPDQGLLNQETRYFHKELSLRTHYYLADTNILDLGKETEVLLARYKFNKNKIRVLLVKYPEKENAQKAARQFKKIYLDVNFGENEQDFIKKIERGEFISVSQRDRFLVLVFEAKEKEICQQLTQNILGKLKEVYRCQR